MNGRTQIVVALIGLAGVIGGAWITATVRPESKSTPRREPPPQSASSSSSSSDRVVATKPTGLEVTGVTIGTAEDELSFAVPKTQFDERAIIAVTVRFAAEDRVRDFPVRLSARITSASLGWGDEERLSDISESGDSFRTFRFQLKNGREWAPGQHVVTISANGTQAYSQLVDIASD